MHDVTVPLKADAEMPDDPAAMRTGADDPVPVRTAGMGQGGG